MEFTKDELILLIEGVNKKIWQIDHVGSVTPRRARYVALRQRLVDEYNTREV